MVESKLGSTYVVSELLLVRLKTRVSVRRTTGVPEYTWTTTSEPWTDVTVPNVAQVLAGWPILPAASVHWTANGYG